MVRVWVAGKTVWSLRYTRAISESFRDSCKMLYKFTLFTFSYDLRLFRCFADFVKSPCHIEINYYPDDVHVWTAGRLIDPTNASLGFQWRLNNGRSLPMVYNKWLPGSPNNEGNMQHCVQLLEKHDGWDDISCATTHCCVCEIELWTLRLWHRRLVAYRCPVTYHSTAPVVWSYMHVSCVVK